MYLQVQLCPDTGETPVADVIHTCLGSLRCTGERTTRQDVSFAEAGVTGKLHLALESQIFITFKQFGLYPQKTFQIILNHTLMSFFPPFFFSRKASTNQKMPNITTCVHLKLSFYIFDPLSPID